MDSFRTEWTLCLLTLLTGDAIAANFTVAPTGRYANDGTRNSPWNLSRALEVASGGDVVELRGGAYAQVLRPQNGGSPGAPLVFRAAAGEQVLFTGMAADDVPVQIVTDHVTVDGIDVKKALVGSGKQFNIAVSGDSVEIVDCRIVGTDPLEDRRRGARETGIRILKPSRGTTVENCDIAGLSHVGIHVADGATEVVIRNNAIHDHYMDAIRFDHSHGRLRGALVEDNALYGSVISDGIQFNGDFASPSYPDDASNCGTVIRGNRIYGNAENGIDLKGTCRILIEKNEIFGNRGDNDGDYDRFPTCGSVNADRCGGVGGITRGGPTVSRDVIIRHNIIYDNLGGVAVGGDGWTVYNNTILGNNRDYTGANSGWLASDKPYFFGMSVGGGFRDVGIKNNLIGGHADVALRFGTDTLRAEIDGNVYYGAARFSYRTDPWTSLSLPDWQQELARWTGIDGAERNSLQSASGGFVGAGDRPTMGGQYDFALNGSSAAVDAGVALTRTRSAGYGTQLDVESARYFSAGLGAVAGDLIRIDGTAEAVRIEAIDYATGRVSVDRSVPWAEGAGVHLLYAGRAPDAGAVEYGAFGRPGQQTDPSAGTAGGLAEKSAANYVAATAQIDIYRADYGRFNFELTNDAASTQALIGATLEVSGTRFDAFDTGGSLVLSPPALSSNNSVTSTSAQLSFDGGLAAGEMARGVAGDFDPYPVPASIRMTLEYSAGLTLDGEFIRTQNRWHWSESATTERTSTVIEAEDMTLAGYSVENGNRIKLSRSCCLGTASYVFAGPPGRYDVAVIGVSESDGPARLDVTIGANIYRSFIYEIAPAASEFLLESVDLSRGDVLVLTGTFASGAFARIDRVEFRPSQ